MSRPNAPQVKIGDPVRANLQAVPDLGCQPWIGHGVEQHRSRRSQQPVRPEPNDQRADNAHHRVHPIPTKEAPGEKRHYREDRSQGIGEHMRVGGTQVVVVVLMLVFVVVLVPCSSRNSQALARLTPRPRTAMTIA